MYVILLIDECTKKDQISIFCEKNLAIRKLGDN